MTRAGYIVCTGCGNEADAATSRQAVLCWPRSGARKLVDDRAGVLTTTSTGTMTDPQEIEQLDVWLCRTCWGRKIGRLRSRTLWPYLDRIITTLRQMAWSWADPKDNYQRDLFGARTDERSTA